jgi:leucyl aminopeptidase (aminopeptidase T)
MPERSDRFASWFSEVRPLEEAAKVAINEALAVSKGERVLIVTNPDRDVTLLSAALYDAALGAGARPLMATQPTKGQLDFADEGVCEAIGTQPEVIISMSRNKLGKDATALAQPIEEGGRHYDSRYHWLLGTKRSRGFWSPGTSVDMFTRTVPIDYARLKREAAWLKGKLDRAVRVRIASPAGTDLVIGVAGREAMLDDGDLRSPGAGGNLPAGESFISPQLGVSEGTLVFDGSMATHTGTIVLTEPIRTTVEGGLVRAVAGGDEAKLLSESLRLGEEQAFAMGRDEKLPEGKAEEYARNTWNLGELGVGLNPSARIVGTMLEDEKAYRTCHVAIGANYDDDAPALIHFDGLIREPTIVVEFIDGAAITILEAGDLRMYA